MQDKKIGMRLILSLCMLLWGSIGLFTRYIELSAFELAFFRAFLALPVLGILSFLRKGKNKTGVKILIPYIVSGMGIGLAWTALFLGYENTSISTTVLIYNMCPVYVMILSPYVLNEKLTRLQFFSILGCFLGLYFLIDTSIKTGPNSFKGIFFACVSGIIYAYIVLMNKKINLSPIFSKVDTVYGTFIQLLGASLVLLPYQLMHGSFSRVLHLAGGQLASLLILSIIHTGLAYPMYFLSYKKLKAVEIVSLSYLEPLFSIFLSVLFLGENLGNSQIIGGVLILTLTYVNEYRTSVLATRNLGTTK
ncbi:EamA family transporter [uncultured Sphaerochaeta sp.]|uniref:DMT family transporter n=1 Tax=uncultured Sphaerochaeta sp. TaxID=886478 RepID=UPI002A0A83DD|nr:EamA family transporter [uncultured Sphaerochaeta sp.]